MSGSCGTIKADDVEVGRHIGALKARMTRLEEIGRMAGMITDEMIEAALNDYLGCDWDASHLEAAKAGIEMVQQAQPLHADEVERRLLSVADTLCKTSEKSFVIDFNQLGHDIRAALSSRSDDRLREALRQIADNGYRLGVVDCCAIARTALKDQDTETRPAT